MNDADPPTSAAREHTYIRRSYHLGTSQEALQRNWSLYRQRRHREYKELPPSGARLVTWSDQINVVCGTCRNKLGAVVLFSTDDRYGLVEDTARWADRIQPAVLTGQVGRHPPWLWVEANGRAARAHIWCRRCRRATTRNAHRLAQHALTDGAKELGIS